MIVNQSHKCPTCRMVCDCRDGYMDVENCLHECSRREPDEIDQDEEG